MRWFHWLGGVTIIAALGGGWFAFNFLNASLLDEKTLAKRRAQTAAQDETAFHQPATQPASYPAPNPLNNVYFGDLHVHSELSFDAYLFGNRISIDQAYDIAKGKPVENAAGELMRLTRPLDFAAITDHAEGFGLHETCALPAPNEGIKEFCRKLENPSRSFFLELRESGETRPPVSPLDAMIVDHQKRHALAQSTWQDIVAVADKHNEPGRFTAFAAYEYSPPLPDTGKIHRNVIFKNSSVPSYAVSAFHALTEIDLWRQLQDNCASPCEFLTIPHNPNKSWGLAFASHTIDGDAYTIDDWKLRDQLEPIVEMFQIKGNSECAIGFGTTDEECGIEQFFPRCEDGQETLCIAETSMARDGLKKGLQLEEEMGFNPLDFGMIGSTDTHNSNPGDAEEWDFRGASGVFSSPAAVRRGEGKPKSKRTALTRNPGGLAAVWAEENTRAALFEAMQRREVYATSGTRIKLRFFGGFGFVEGFETSDDVLPIAYAQGVPMGSYLGATPTAEQPEFLVWAVQDPLDAPLDRVQIVKGWLEDGETREQVYDVLCADGRAPSSDTKKCPATSATVDLKTCAWETGKGAEELKTVWRDQSFQPGQSAFYYVRVIQNPTCRWSSYDSLRLGLEPPEDFPATTTEMAWSSPIWISGIAK